MSIVHFKEYVKDDEVDEGGYGGTRNKKDSRDKYNKKRKGQGMISAEVEEGTVLQMTDVDQWSHEIYKGIDAGWKSVSKSTLGGDENVALMIKLTLEPEKDWPSKILHNASYAMIRVATNGAMEMFASGLGKGKNMRKTKVKSAKDVVTKINKWINTVSEEVVIDEGKSAYDKEIAAFLKKGGKIKKLAVSKKEVAKAAAEFRKSHKKMTQKEIELDIEDEIEAQANAEGVIVAEGKIFLITEKITAKDYDALKKGDTVVIEYGSAMSGGKASFKVTAKNVVGKAKVGKITLKSVTKPNSVKHFLYKRGDKVSMAQGDMGVTVKSFTKEEVELGEAKILKKGTEVKVAHPAKGKGMVTGKVVRYDDQGPGSPFYVIDIGERMSEKVPAHKIKEDVDLTEKAKIKALHLFDKQSDADKKAKEIGGQAVQNKADGKWAAILWKEEVEMWLETQELQAKMALDDAGIEYSTKNNSITVKKSDKKKAQKAFEKSFKKGGWPTLKLEATTLTEALDKKDEKVLDAFGKRKSAKGIMLKSDGEVLFSTGKGKKDSETTEIAIAGELARWANAGQPQNVPGSSKQAKSWAPRGTKLGPDQILLSKRFQGNKYDQFTSQMWMYIQGNIKRKYIADFRFPGYTSEEVSLHEVLKSKDKSVIDSFYDKEVNDNGRILSTNGNELYKMGMGAQPIAHWEKGKIKIVAKMDVKSTEEIVRYMQKSIPKNNFEERDYRKEYDNYQGKPEQIARRSSRNQARRVMGDKTEEGKDVGHKDNNPLNNDPKNLRNEDPSKNRREPRLRKMESFGDYYNRPFIFESSRNDIYNGSISSGVELEKYAKKSGGIDKDDLLATAAILKKGKLPSAKQIPGDTSPRDKVFSIMGKHLAKKYLKKYKGSSPALDNAMKEEEENYVVHFTEAYKYKIDHKSYTAAVEEALIVADKAGYEVDMDDYFDKIATGPRKPQEGKTNIFQIALEKGGKEQKKKLQIQIYGKGKHGYELNCYIQ